MANRLRVVVASLTLSEGELDWGTYRGMTSELPRGGKLEEVVKVGGEQLALDGCLIEAGLNDDSKWTEVGLIVVVVVCGS